MLLSGTGSSFWSYMTDEIKASGMKLVEDILTRLREGTYDLADFCFEREVAHGPDGKRYPTGRAFLTVELADPNEVFNHLRIGGVVEDLSGP